MLFMGGWSILFPKSGVSTKLAAFWFSVLEDAKNSLINHYKRKAQTQSLQI
jgi:hypothetical protein